MWPSDHFGNDCTECVGNENTGELGEIRRVSSFIINVHLTSYWCKPNYTCVTNVHWNILISAWLFEWVRLGHSTVDIFTPTLFFFCIFSDASFSITVRVGWLQKDKKKKKRVGEVGYSSIRHQPTQNYSMWWYKSYLIMWEHAGLPAAMKGARCSDIPGEEASWTVSHAAGASLLILGV